MLLVTDRRESCQPGPCPLDVFIGDDIAELRPPGTETVGAHLPAEDSGDETGRIALGTLDVFGHVIGQTDGDAALSPGMGPLSRGMTDV